MPMNISLATYVANLSDTSPKNYLWAMGTHGVEMGIARGGQYSAHAHRNMADVIFAPGGMHSGAPDSPGYMSGTLLVALPGTWFGPVVSADFFFVKFYCSKHRTGVPDKISDYRLLDVGSNGSLNGLMIARGSAILRLPIFRPGRQQADDVAEIHLRPDGLLCKFPGPDVIMVTELNL